MAKFLSGILSDKSNPRYFMAIGLFLTGLANLFFGLSSNLYVLLFCGELMHFSGWGILHKITHTGIVNERVDGGLLYQLHIMLVVQLFL